LAQEEARENCTGLENNDLVFVFVLSNKRCGRTAYLP